MTPREHLQNKLAKEKSGSPKIKALSDMMSLQYAQHKFEEAMKNEDMVSDHNIVALMFEQVVIAETMRKRRFGKHGGEYNKMLDGLDEYIASYYESPGETLPSKVILDDLQEINTLKAKSTKKPKPRRRAIYKKQ